MHKGGSQTLKKIYEGPWLGLSAETSGLVQETWHASGFQFWSHYLS